jgi:hypothetical protein
VADEWAGKLAGQLADAAIGESAEDLVDRQAEGSADGLAQERTGKLADMVIGVPVEDSVDR